METKPETDADKKLRKGLYLQPGSRNWYYQYMVNGKRVKGCTGECDVAKAASVLARIKAEAGLVKTLASPTQKALMRDIEKSVYSSRIALANTWAEYMANQKETKFRQAQSKWVADFVAFMGSYYPHINHMHEVSSMHAESWLSYISENGPYVKSVNYIRGGKVLNYEMSYTVLSAESIKKYVAICRQVFSSLAKSGSFEDNPFDGLKLPKIRQDESGREIYTESEIVVMLSKADDFTMPLVMLGLYTGLREGDICGLKWASVNMETKTISHVMRKTGRRIVIPIVGGLFDFLSAQPHESEFVFPKHAEMYATNRTGVSYRFSHWLTDISIKEKKEIEKDESGKPIKSNRRNASKKDCHSLRHTFVYLALTKYGIPLPIVQGVVGHVSEKMTRLYSAHATLEDMRLYMAHMDSAPPVATLKEQLEKVAALNDLDAIKKALADIVSTL